MASVSQGSHQPAIPRSAISAVIGVSLQTLPLNLSRNPIEIADSNPSVNRPG